MPNHYTNVILVTHADTGLYSNYDERRASWLARLAEFAKDPFEATIPQSDAAKLTPVWLQEADTNWGTKWGGYDAMLPVELPGDGSPVLLVFCTAWGPGHAAARAAIRRYAMERLDCATFAWIGFDPYDDRTVALMGVDLA